MNHRRIGELDVYMVMDVPQGTSCTFQSLGRVELWNTWTGERRILPVQQQTNRETKLRIPNPAHEASIIVPSVDICRVDRTSTTGHREALKELSEVF